MCNKYPYYTGASSSGLSNVVSSAIHCTDFLPVFQDMKIIRKMILRPQGICKVVYSHLLGWGEHHLQADVSNEWICFLSPFSDWSQEQECSAVNQNLHAWDLLHAWGRLHHRSKGGDFRGSRCMRLWFPHLLVMKFMTSEGLLSWEPIKAPGRCGKERQLARPCLSVHSICGMCFCSQVWIHQPLGYTEDTKEIRGRTVSCVLSWKDFLLSVLWPGY